MLSRLLYDCSTTRMIWQWKSTIDDIFFLQVLIQW
jgi:hypothetical protein